MAPTASFSPSPGTERFGVVGAGAIGSGVARLLSGLGAQTIVVAPRPGGVERATDQIRRWYASDVKHGRLNAARAAESLKHVVVTPSYAALEDATFVIESVPEELALKQSVLAAVEAHASPSCIFASNTSSIPLAAIAAGARRPQQVIGTHYFWPAHRYRLVEIARADRTSPDTLRRTLDMVRWQGKVTLLVRDVPGFFTTRVLMAYLNEAVALVGEGASVEAVDGAMQAFGWAMGPFRLLDAVGLEKFRGIHRWVSGRLGERVGEFERLWPVLEAGHIGCRGGRDETAKGFYQYPRGSDADARVYPLIGRRARAVPPAGDIAVRPVWQMLNEIGHCLADGVVASADDADRGVLLALGWPLAQGSPLTYARRVGVTRIAEQLTAWSRRYGARFTPSPVLTEWLDRDACEASKVTGLVVE